MRLAILPLGLSWLVASGCVSPSSEYQEICFPIRPHDQVRSVVSTSEEPRTKGANTHSKVRLASYSPGLLAKQDAAAEQDPPAPPESAADAPSEPKKQLEETPAPPPTSTSRSPAYLMQQEYPVDLPTVIRLVNENSPGIGLARARVEEAWARRRKAELLWLPNLSAGGIYNRYDGQTQNQRGEVFEVSRSNLFGGMGIQLGLDFSEAIYRPLIEQRLESAEQNRARAAEIASELDAVLAYLDLLQAHALKAINAETLQMAQATYEAAKNAQEAKLNRTAGDVNRANTELLLRKNERVQLQGSMGVASARLSRLLLLPPGVKLTPINPEVVPLSLISSDTKLDELIAIAIANRPDAAAHRDILAAAWENVRKAENAHLLPKLTVANQGGSFGGGINGDLQNFEGRNFITANLMWEVENLGFGNQLKAHERRANATQMQFQLVETQARLSAEVVEAAQLAAARHEGLELSKLAIEEATELYRISREGTFNVVDAKNLYDALRPLQAIQFLNQSRVNYLNALVEFNRAQYRLYAALGYPPYLMTMEEIATDAK